MSPPYSQLTLRKHFQELTECIEYGNDENPARLRESKRTVHYPSKQSTAVMKLNP